MSVNYAIHVSKNVSTMLGHLNVFATLATLLVLMEDAKVTETLHFHYLHYCITKHKSALLFSAHSTCICKFNQCFEVTIGIQCTALIWI